MTIHELLEEYNLATDDVRWSLSNRIGESVVALLENEGPEALTRRIWSGEFGDDLYDLEERWIRDRDDRLRRAILDEGHLRDELSGMVLDRVNRRRN